MNNLNIDKKLPLMKENTLNKDNNNSIYTINSNNSIKRPSKLFSINNDEEKNKSSTNNLNESLKLNNIKIKKRLIPKLKISNKS